MGDKRYFNDISGRKFESIQEDAPAGLPPASLVKLTSLDWTLSVSGNAHNETDRPIIQAFIEQTESTIGTKGLDGFQDILNDLQNFTARKSEEHIQKTLLLFNNNPLASLIDLKLTAKPGEDTTLEFSEGDVGASLIGFLSDSTLEFSEKLKQIIVELEKGEFYRAQDLTIQAWTENNVEYFADPEDPEIIEGRKKGFGEKPSQADKNLLVAWKQEYIGKDIPRSGTTLSMDDLNGLDF